MSYGLQGRSYIFFQLDFSSGGGAPLSAVILAGRSQRRNPCEVRSSLSQSPSRCTSLQPAGQKTATGSFYASVRFVNEIRLSVMAGAANRLTMSITTGSGSIAAAVPIAGRPSPSFRCSLLLTRITAYWRAARHCCCALWRAVAGTRHCRGLRTLIDYPIPRPSGAGRVVWTRPSWLFPFSVRPSPV